jgi:hypothetical protein
MTDPAVAHGRARTPLRRPMGPRDHDEHDRSATPLELLFDLCFVVAVAQAADHLHHALVEGHIADGVRLSDPGKRRSRLSAAPGLSWGDAVVGVTGIEPVTSSVSGPR